MVISPPILGPLAAYVGWMMLLVRGAFEVGIWTTDLWKPTLLWIGLAGVAVIFNLTDAMSKEDHFRRTMVEALGVSLLIEFIVTLRSFPLSLEIPAQAVAVLAGLALVVAQRDPKMRPAQRRLNGYLVVFGLCVFVWSLVGLIGSWSDIDRKGLLFEFLLPVWLTPGALAFLYAFAVVASFQTNFKRMRIWRRDGRLWRQRLALLVRANIRLAPHRWLAGGRLGQVAKASGIRSAWREIGAARDTLACRQRREREARQRLLDNAGRPGEDDDGQRYDRREFAATCSTLRFLHSCHAGHYRHNDRYKPELFGLLSVGLARDGLPDDHGIECHVSADGQSWYSYRETVTGWWFGIGAKEGPPDEWMYDGPHAPAGIPNEAEWDRFGVGDHSRNWT